MSRLHFSVQCSFWVIYMPHTKKAVYELCKFVQRAIRGAFHPVIYISLISFPGKGPGQPVLHECLGIRKVSIQVDVLLGSSKTSACKMEKSVKTDLQVFNLCIWTELQIRSRDHSIRVSICERAKQLSLVSSCRYPQ